MWRPELEDYVFVASLVLEIPERQLRARPGLTLAESALAAPFAGFGDVQAYPSLELKAAVLLERVARNHPLPDGNKRAAFALTLLFLRINGQPWQDPDANRDGPMVEQIAAGERSHEEIARWIAERTQRSSPMGS